MGDFPQNEVIAYFVFSVGLGHGRLEVTGFAPKVKMKKVLTTFRLSILIAITTLLVAFFLMFTWLPNVAALAQKNPERTRFMEMYLKTAESRGRPPVITYYWKNADQISGNLKRAVLIAEDDAFYSHDGFDWAQLKQALEKDWAEKKLKRGGSTITQQLVKNLYLTPDRSVLRKFREAIITYQMEHTLSKKRIFELYLNVAEWGPGIFGAEAAARHYFKKSAANLSAYESAYLAAILPNPTLYASKAYGRRTNWKTNLILSRMGR